MDNLQIEKKISTEIEKLLFQTEDYKHSDQSIHKIEMGLLGSLLKLGLVLLHSIISHKSNELLGHRPEILEGEKLTSKGAVSRQYLSLFGLMSIRRTVHWSKDRKSYSELDEELSLPKTLWSYNLQELVGESSSENDFRNSVSLLNKLLKLGLSGKASQRNASFLGDQVGQYYDRKSIELETTAVCFSASFDGKGVPKIVKPLSPTGNPKKRLGKGEKKGLKEMATVVVTSCFTPKIRDKGSIIRSLMGSGLTKLKPIKEEEKAGNDNDNRWHEKIHRRAFLADQAKAIEYGLDSIRVRMVNSESRFVVPIDAGIGLEEKVLAYVKKHKMESQFDGIILDIIHVSEYVWDTANAVLGEQLISRHNWVKRMLEDLLDSKVEKVIEDLKLIIEQQDLTDHKIKQIQKTITYFSNHKHKMDYKTYLAKGYPVSSALVESACGHLVKQRMEQSGMRWCSKGAQNMLDLRALKLNGDLEDFIQFVTDTNQHSFYKKAV